MAERTLANPTIEVNDQVISIKPNSITYKGGKGEKNVRTQSAGGDSVELVVTENAETKKSMCKFMLFNTKKNIDLLKSWQDVGLDGSTIRLSDGDFVVSFRGMQLITDPDINLGADGELEAEFEGLPTT